MHAFINAAAPWLNEHIKSFIRRHVPDVVFVDDPAELPPGVDTVFQWCDGWGLNESFAALNAAKNGLINAYPNSDALARKDFLAAVVEYWAAKRPGSILRKHVPHTVRLTLDYSEMRGGNRQTASGGSSSPLWVDCGAGIRLFSTVEELAGHLELAEDETDDEEEEETSSGDTDTEATIPGDSDNDKDTSNNPPFTPSLSTPGLDSLDILVTATRTLTLTPNPKHPLTLRTKKARYTFKANNRIPSSQLRAFVAQRYLTSIPPLNNNRKWHVRAYALAIGRLKVHLFRDMLVLLAAEPYRQPWENPSLRASLTSTALQGDEEIVENESMRDFWGGGVDVEQFAGGDKGGWSWKTHVFYQICGVAAEVFRAAVHTMGDKFVTVDKCFEVFALDFLMDSDGKAWLLALGGE